MENDRRLEILGILIIALSVFILVSLLGYNSNEEPSISPNIQIDNPMGILGLDYVLFAYKKGFWLRYNFITNDWICLGLVFIFKKATRQINPRFSSSVVFNGSLITKYSSW